jgi:hypothetical protein
MSLLSLSSAVAAQDDRPREGHWSCYSDYNQSTVYTSPVWDATAFMDQVSNGFGQFLFAKYGYKGRVSCSRADLSGSTLAGLTAGNRDRNAQWKAGGKPVVETTFTFDPAKTSLAYACVGFARVRAGGEFTDSIFLSRVLRIPGTSRAGLELAWNDHINGVHSGSPIYPGGCTLLSPDPAAHQAQIDAMPSAYNARNPAIVRLDWTYAPRP